MTKGPDGRLGVVHPDGERVLDVARLDRPDLPGTCDALVACGDGILPLLREAVDAADAIFWIPLRDLRVDAPLRRPGKVMAIGLNYREHAEEQSRTPPERPLIFCKFPSAIIGPGVPIRIPAASAQIDYEVELAVVIGRRGRFIERADASRHVFGYTILNDVTARDLQKSDRQWVRSKSFDTFCPMGPVMVTASEFEFPPALDIRLRVNGEERQRSNTANMIFDVGALVHDLSQAFTLEPGDVIATGTPSGVGVFRTPPVFLHPGDVVEAEIDGIGVLRNPVAR